MGDFVSVRRRRSGLRGLFFDPQGCEVSKLAQAAQRPRSLGATGVRGEESLGILMPRAGEKASGRRGSRRVSPLRDGRGQGAGGSWSELTWPRSLLRLANESEHTRHTHTRTPTSVRARASVHHGTDSTCTHAVRHSFIHSFIHSFVRSFVHSFIQVSH